MAFAIVFVVPRVCSLAITEGHQYCDVDHPRIIQNASNDTLISYISSLDNVAKILAGIEEEQYWW